MKRPGRGPLLNMGTFVDPEFYIPHVPSSSSRLAEARGLSVKEGGQVRRGVTDDSAMVQQGAGCRALLYMNTCVDSAFSAFA